MALQVVAALAIASLLASPSPLHAQASDGHLIGTVFDQVGGSITGAAVTVANESTGVTWNVAADDFGAYRFNNLPVAITASRHPPTVSQQPPSRTLP